MRIIGGIHRGRQFHPPPLDPTRPTTDFAKEAIFNILQNTWDFEGLKVLELFAGTGAFSYEFASRGAESITAIENSNSCAAFIKKTAEQFDLKQIKVIKMDVFKFIQTTNEKYDIIFADPPYSLEKLATLPDLIFEKGLLNTEGLLILEHSTKNDFQKHPHFVSQRKYGNTIFAMFE